MVCGIFCAICPFVVIGKYTLQTHKASIFYDVPTLHTHPLFISPLLAAEDGKNQGLVKSGLKVKAGRGQRCAASTVTVWSISLVSIPHLNESCESRGSSKPSSATCSSSSSCRSPPPRPDPSPDWELEGPGREPMVSEIPVPGASEGVAVCMIFWRTSLIFS